MKTCLILVTFCSLLLPLAAEEVFVAVGYGGRRLLSTDGKTWEITEEWAQPGGDDSNNLMGLAFGHGKFVAVGGGGGGPTAGGHILISRDGRTWKEAVKTPNRVNPIVFGNGRFVTGGPASRSLMWSSDGENWESGAQIQDKVATHFRHGAYGNGVFVLTGNHGGNGGPFWAVTTSDGTTIDSFDASLPPIRALEFGAGHFVIVGGEGTRSFSKDGVSWTHQPTGDEKETLSWVIWTGERFLCGGGKTVYASPDGKTWEATALRFPGGPRWTDGKRFISSSWPGKMSFSGDGGQTWTAGNPMTANGINKVVRGEIK